jgi:hypothetical protein
MGVWKMILDGMPKGGWGKAKNKIILRGTPRAN